MKGFIQILQRGRLNESVSFVLRVLHLFQWGGNNSIETKYTIFRIRKVGIFFKSRLEPFFVPSRSSLNV